MSASSLSPAQSEAEWQARLLHREVDDYQRILPPPSYFPGTDGVCRADGWNVSHQHLNGEFDLDEAVARELVTAVLKADGMRGGSAPAPIVPDSPQAGVRSWLEEYLAGETIGQTSSPKRLLSEMKSAAVGPGNILSNMNELKSAANAALQERTAKALRAAARGIESGAAQTVRINQYMTLYNANRSGKGRPRPRVRISGLPMQVVAPALGPGVARSAAYGANARMIGTDALRAQKLGGLTAGAHWSGKAAFLSGRVGGGVLTFAPSLALDIYGSIERDMDGDWRFDRKKFLIASARSQSGNVAGMVGAAGATALATVVAVGISGVALTAAPLILIGLLGGYAAQVVWNGTGRAEWAGAVAERALRP